MEDVTVPLGRKPPLEKGSARPPWRKGSQGMTPKPRAVPPETPGRRTPGGGGKNPHRGGGVAHREGRGRQRAPRERGGVTPAGQRPSRRPRGREAKRGGGVSPMIPPNRKPRGRDWEAKKPKRGENPREAVRLPNLKTRNRQFEAKKLLREKNPCGMLKDHNVAAQCPQCAGQRRKRI